MNQLTPLSDIHIRDPFLLTRVDTADYLLFGSTDPDIWEGPGVGFDCYRSNDLVNWSGPIAAFRPTPGFWADRNFWAPEVHTYLGRYYMLATLKSADRRRGTQIFVSDRAEGPYQEWSSGPVTPSEWECLDGTLHVDGAGEPWIVYCHEWLQVVDGRIVAQRLTTDLRATRGEPVVLFAASAAPWVRPTTHEWMVNAAEGYVTDGPFLHRLASGELIMLWSSFGERGYAMGVSRSTSGDICGPWAHEDQPLWAADGGHGMIGRSLGGQLLLAIHQPNDTPHERAVFWPLSEEAQSLRLAPHTPPTNF